MFSDPFKHAVLENFADPQVLDEIVRQWPRDKSWWQSHNHKNSSGKRSIGKIDRMPYAAQKLILELNQAPLVEKFSQMLGYTLIPDPYIVTQGSLWGGGLHEIQRGGFLKVHVDFNVHPLKVYRRANLLIYLNRDWMWGGDLELWDADKCVRAVSPDFNKAVLFETSEISWHGHPVPLGCPQDVTRKSIAIYYYTAESEPVKSHATIYRET
jgi:Rps23 Pro-64 3,4-dihydroxylase Tpa1-like proline 4-hydroxylase